MLGWVESNVGLALALVLVLLTTLAPLLFPIVVKISRRGQRPRTATLKILHSPANAKFEIVAVHGLGADPNHTWTRAVPADSCDRHQEPDAVEGVGRHCPKRIHLLEDLLPIEFPEARILSFEHNSNWLIDAPVKTTEEIGKNLLEETTAKRFHPHLPIIFIGHSLGGIIIKQALCGHDFQDIVDDISGIIFLGTPHYGSSISAAAAVLAFVTGFLGSDTTLLLSLRSHGAQLSNLARTFRARIAPNEHRRQKVRVISFYETMPMYLLGWLSIGSVVSRDSAVVHADEEHSIDTDHSGLNKCAGSGDGLFLKLKQAIADLRAPSLLTKADAYIHDKHYAEKRLMIERLSGESLPMEQCYINLSIVEKPGGMAYISEEAPKEADSADQTSPFSVLARQKVQTPNKTIQVELATIFNERQRPNGDTIKPRRILIRGRAGVGKTTLCKKIVHEFTRGAWVEWSKSFHRVLWVPLRNLKLQERRQVPGYNYEDLFYHEYFSGEGQDDGRCLARELWRALKDTRSSGSLFILDGLDEVSQDLEHADAMSQFLKELLKQPNVIITSRPSARPPPDMDLELETVGFYSDQVKDYIEHAFTDREKMIVDAKKVDEVQSFLQSHWLIEGLVRIPIQLDALCYTWDGLTPEDIPDSMTCMYRLIELKLWKKDVIRLEKKHDGKLVTPAQTMTSDAEDFVQDEVCLLEGLAFTGMYNNVIDFTSKDREAISKHFKPQAMLLDKTLPCLSFVRTPDPSSKVKHQNYHFIHLTFQEYFAARYFIRQWHAGRLLKCLELGSEKIDEIEPACFVQKHKYTARYDIFWRFVAGLLDATQQASPFVDLIEKEPVDLLGPAHQRLVMHCLSEISNSLRIRQKLETRLSQWLLFELDLTGSSLLARESECPEKSILAVLKTDSGSGRRGVLQALPHRGARLSDTAIMALTALLDDESQFVRSDAAEVLGGQPTLSDAAIEALTRLLRNGEQFDGSTAARALGGQSNLPDAAIAGLTVLLQDEESHVRSAAAEALGAQSNLPDAIIEPLTVLLQDEGSNVRSAAAGALGAQSNLPDAAIAGVMALLQDKESHVRYAAAEALRSQPNLSDVGFTERLQHKELLARSFAAIALGSQPNLSDAAIAGLTGLLQDEKSLVRSAAAGALGAQSNLSDAAIAGLTVLLQDKESNVRSAVAKALGPQTNLSDAAIAGLTVLLQDKESHVRYAAAEALGRQSSFLEKTLEAMGLMLESEPPAKSMGNTFRNPQFLESLYGSLLCRSFREQLSLYVDGIGGSCSCIINQPSGLRTASFEDDCVEDQFCVALGEGRQLWNIHGYELWVFGV